MLRGGGWREGGGGTEGAWEERCRGGVRGTARRRACAIRVGVRGTVNGPASVCLWWCVFFFVIGCICVNWHESDDFFLSGRIGRGARSGSGPQVTPQTGVWTVPREEG